MLRQRHWSGAELRSFVTELGANDPSLFAELDAIARQSLDRPGATLEGLDPAAAELNRIALESALPGEEFGYESIILRRGRPVLAIQHNALDARVIDDDAAGTIRDRLKAAESRIARAIPAVGRIEVQNNPLYDWVGTGWLVDQDVIVTNRHVAQAFGMRDQARFVFRPGLDRSRPQTARIDFVEEIGVATVIEVAVTEIIWIAPDSGPDVAFLRLSAQRPGVVPIGLASAQPAKRTHVAVIGYPARDSRVPDSVLMDRIFGEVYDKKRLAPGQITAWTEDELQHDCSTLGGNSGSVVLDLASGKALGLHFSGIYLRSNFAVPAGVIDRLRRARPWQGADRPTPGSDRAAAAGQQPGVGPQSAGGTVRFTLPLTIEVRLGDPVAGTGPTVMVGHVAPAGTPATTVEAAAEVVRSRLSGLPEVISVRPGYAFRDGWITSERVVVVRLRRDASQPAEAGALASDCGYPVVFRDADPAEVLIGAMGMTDTEAPYRYVSTYRRDLAGPFALGPQTVDSILCHASPDAGWPELERFLGDTRSELVVGIYDVSAPHVVQRLETSLKSRRGSPGKRLALVLDPKESLGRGTKARDLPEDEVIARLARIGRIDFTHARVPMVGPRRLFHNAYHIKVAVRDHAQVWLSSGNWQSSGQPDVAPPFGQGQDPKVLKTYNREWHAIVESPALAAAFRAHLEQDLADAQALPTGEALDLPDLPRILVPTELLEPPDEELPARATYFAPHLARNVTVTPLLSPDNYATETLCLVRSARRKLLIQNQSFKPGRPETDPRFAEILDAVLDKQRQGLDVRIIFRRIGDVPDTLERIQSYGFDMARVHLQTNCHTKGIIVDDAAVLLGSHNWTAAGVIYNRDASLLIKDAGVAAYFGRLFEFDWARTRARRVSTERSDGQARPVIAVMPGTEVAAPDGYTMVDWHEWTRE